MENNDLARRLTEPFHPDEVHFKPQSVKGNRALAIAYTDARVVMDRLDAVLGVGGWQDAYDELAGGSVQCTLKIRIGDCWISKSDVGSQSEQPDDGDKLKAAFSDALKRAAVKLGIGRYLYSLPKTWCDYDPEKKQLVTTPRLPAWALPHVPDDGKAALLDEIQATLKQRHPGVSTADKLASQALIVASFKTKSWPAVEALDADTLRAGLGRLREIIGTSGNRLIGQLKDSLALANAKEGEQ
jgi:hypothetical protein